jgi:hypothetical protein
MKNLILLAVLAGSLFTSCKKNDPPPALLLPRVKAAIEKDGSINYTYDDKWRLAKYDSRSKVDTNVKEYTYTDSTVKVRNYYGNNVYSGTIIYHLNARGLAETMVDTSVSLFNTFTYNSNNQVLTLHVSRTTRGILYEWDYKYFYNSNGDLDSSTAFVKNTGVTTRTYYPKYDLSHTTTIGNENIGLSFIGASSKHPPLQITMTGGAVLSNYGYTYDASGKVATQNINVGDVPYLSYTFTYY